MIQPRRIKLAPVTPDPQNPGVNEFTIDYSAITPTEIDYRPLCPVIENQNEEGDCTANSTVGEIGIYMSVAGNFVQLSENFNYWTSRYLLNGNVAPTTDSGSTLGFALLAASTYGVCTEATWPSSSAVDPSDPDLEIQPSDAAYAEALGYRINGYLALPPSGPPISLTNDWFNVNYSATAIQYVLAKGYCINLALSVGYSIYDLAPGAVYQSINAANGNQDIGGHAIIIVGYTTINGLLVWICRNSWGNNWCMSGYFYMASNVPAIDGIEMYVVTNFNGDTTIAKDSTSYLPTPTSSTLIQDAVTYVFKTHFGRFPAVTGLNFWVASFITYMEQQIVADAGATDLAYMKNTPINSSLVVPSGETSISDIVTYVFEANFGRAPLTAGLLYWVNVGLNYLNTQIVADASIADQQFMTYNQTQGLK